MRRLWFVAAGAALAVGGFLFFFAGGSHPTNYPSAGTDIIAFGDSLVYGTGATEGNDFVSLVASRIGRPIVNLGRPGDTTADGIERLREFDQYAPNVVLVLFGGNDYLRRVAKAQTFKNLSFIIEDLHRRGAVVLLLGVRGGVLSDQFSGEFKALAKRYGTAYVPDVLSGVLGNPELLSDRIHPNDAGYARIAERVAPELKRLLE